MRNCFCRKCGTQNTIEEGELTYFCANCGQPNNVPKAAAPVNNETPQYKMPEQAATYAAPKLDNIYAPVQETVAPVQEEVPTQSYTDNQNAYMPQNNMYASGTINAEPQDKPKKKKKTGLVVFLVTLFLLIAAAVVILITPIKTPVPLKFRCDKCGKFKMSYEYHLDDTDEERYLCDGCLEELGYVEDKR